MLTALDTKSFKEKIISTNIPNVVIFKATWSGSWQILLRTVEQFSEIYHPHVNFYTVDMEQQPDLAKEYNVYQIPTFMFFERGELIDYHAGMLSGIEIKEKLRQFSISD